MKWKIHREWTGKPHESDVAEEHKTNWWSFGRWNIGLRKRQTACFDTWEFGVFRNTDRFELLKTEMRRHADYLKRKAFTRGHYTREL